MAEDTIEQKKEKLGKPKKVTDKIEYTKQPALLTGPDSVKAFLEVAAKEAINQQTVGAIVILNTHNGGPRYMAIGNCQTSEQIVDAVKFISSFPVCLN